MRGRERRRNGSGVVFGARGWADRWKVLRDEGGGCQGNALPASAYFSSARALGSIQHHREFPDQTHPLDTRPSHHHPFYVYISISFPSSPSPPSPSRSFSLVSPLPSGSFPLCFAVVVSSSNFLAPSLSLSRVRLFAIRLSPFRELVTRPPLLLLSSSPFNRLYSRASSLFLSSSPAKLLPCPAGGGPSVQ